MLEIKFSSFLNIFPADGLLKSTPNMFVKKSEIKRLVSFATSKEGTFFICQYQ